MPQDIRKPMTPKELRAFGLLMGSMVVVFFGVLIPWIWGLTWPLWPWLVAVALVGLALARPLTLLPLFRVWEKIGLVLGWINTRILLGAVFFLLVLPIGLAVRLAYDPMARRFDPAAKSYRCPSSQPSPGNFERPF